MEQFGWSLYDIDRTAIESLLPFFFHVAAKKRSGSTPAQHKAFCDQVGWL